MHSTEDRERFVGRHLQRNVIVYFGSAAMLAAVLAFAEPSVLLANLAERLQAPAWVATLPMVALYTICYLPQLVMAWLIGRHHSRRKLYAGTLLISYLPMLALAATLCLVADGLALVVMFAVCVVLFAFAQGLTILPCWDLYARVFPDAERGKVLGASHAITHGVSVLAAGGAAWLVSSHSFLSFPRNYALGLVIFSLGGVAYILIVLSLREYTDYPHEPRPPFRAYCRQLRDAVRENRPFVITLAAVLLCATTAAAPPLLLVYAKRRCGLSEDHVSMLIALRPWVLVPAALAAGWFADRRTPLAVVAAGNLALATGAVALQFLSGSAAIAALLIATPALFCYNYSLLAIMLHAGAGRNHHYLAIFYTLAILPGLAPLGLGWLLEQTPRVSIALLVALSLGIPQK